MFQYMYILCANGFADFEVGRFVPLIQRILHQCNKWYILIFYYKMRWQCRRILHQTEVFGAKCADTLRFYQNVTIDAKCVDRWHIFVTFCDDSIKNFNMENCILV